MLTQNRHDVLFQQCIHTKAQEFLHARRATHHQLLTTQRTELSFTTYSMLRNFSPKLNLEIARSIYPSSVLTARKTKMSLFWFLYIFLKILSLWTSSMKTSATKCSQSCLCYFMFLPHWTCDSCCLWSWADLTLEVCSPITPALKLKKPLQTTFSN